MWRGARISARKGCMERLYFVVNPAAGAGLAKAGFEKVRAELDRRGISYGFAYTEGKGHATLLAREAAENGEKRIVSVGGDGTASEVASALVNTGCVMGMLPFGTGNDLAKTLGIPKEPLEALKLLLLDKPRSMDAGTVNGSLFINVAGLGFDVDVLLNTDRYKARFKGMLPYFLGILRTLAKVSFPHAVIKDDTGRVIEHDVLIVIVGNGSCFGGGMNATPLADVSDGLFDVCVIRKLSRLRMISLLLSFVKGKHVGLEPVEYFKCRELSVECSPQRLLQLDGEVGLATPAEFKILPGALKLLVG